MRRVLLIIYLGLTIGCNTEYTQYYYGEKSFRSLPCYWKHSIAVEDQGDSIKVWNLDDECNAGYWSIPNITIPKAVGTYGDLQIKKITDRKIDLTYDRGYEKVNFTLTRTRNKHEAEKLINITQMLSIDSAFEQHIQSTAKNAQKNNLYLTEDYTADEKAGLLDPNEFYKYYKAKKEKVAEKVIEQLQRKINKSSSDTSLIKKQNKLRSKLLADPKLPSIVKSYIQDTSVIVILDDITDTIRYRSLGDINHDGKKDSVFLMPEFINSDTTKRLGDFCRSFTFTDKSLSRIQEDEGCNQLDNIFVVGDIDEDGLKEIGLYTSSCVSRYKSLRVYSFKKNQWKEVGAVTFDLTYDRPPKEKRIKIISKGKFAMREISDLGISTRFHDEWVPFEIK